MQQQVRLNFLVTITHIAFIVAFTVMSLMNQNFFKDLSSNSLNRFDTALYFFAGMMDLFMACMMWFIMDDSKSSNVIVNENTGTVYQLIDVIQKKTSD